MTAPILWIPKVRNFKKSTWISLVTSKRKGYENYSQTHWLPQSLMSSKPLSKYMIVLNPLQNRGFALHDLVSLNFLALPHFKFPFQKRNLEEKRWWVERRGFFTKPTTPPLYDMVKRRKEEEGEGLLHECLLPPPLLLLPISSWSLLLMFIII